MTVPELLRGNDQPSAPLQPFALRHPDQSECAVAVREQLVVEDERLALEIAVRPLAADRREQLRALYVAEEPVRFLAKRCRPDTRRRKLLRPRRRVNSFPTAIRERVLAHWLLVEDERADRGALGLRVPPRAR